METSSDSRMGRSSGTKPWFTHGILKDSANKIFDQDIFLYYEKQLYNLINDFYIFMEC
jgi:hypothetical protein